MKEDLLRTLDFLSPSSDGVFEVWAKGPQQAFSKSFEGYAAPGTGIISGYFSVNPAALRAVTSLEADAQPLAVYVTRNLVDPSLLARANHRFKSAKRRTGKADIVSLTSILIDVDPIRKSGISATDEEHKAALKIAKEIVTYLKELGWPDPLIGDSGNGAQITYRISCIENTDKNIDLIKRCLSALAHKFDTNEAKIDLGCAEPHQCCRLYGTWNRKGDSTIERPHRQSKILYCPANPQDVTQEQLHELASQAEQKSVGKGAPAACSSGSKSGRLDVEKYLEHYKTEIKERKPVGDSTFFTLSECLFDETHKGGEAAITQAENGQLGYFCFHSSCTHTWAEARKIISGDDKLTPFMEGGVARLSSLHAFSLDDIGNSDRLVDKFGDRSKYDASRKKWLIWDNKRWGFDEKDQVTEFAKATARSIYEEAAQEPDDKLRKLIADHAKRSQSNRAIRDMKILAQSHKNIAITPSMLDSDQWILNVKNGVLDLKNGGQFLSHDPAHLVTKLAPVVFDPNAKCPLWLAYLDDAMQGNKNVIDFLQRMAGYALTGSTKQECLFILWGKGRNGKGTYIETLGTMLGDYATTADTKVLLKSSTDAEQRHEIADLYGTRFIRAQETEDGVQLAEALIKSLTGGDTVKARQMYQEAFCYQPTYKLFLSTNYEPKVTGRDEGIWSRIFLIPFNYTVPAAKRDKDLKTKLRETELSGILNWSLEGLRDWQKRGDIDPPPEVLAATQNYRLQMNPLGRFLVERCTISATATVKFNDVQLEYQEWCSDNGEEPLGARTFLKRLLEEDGIQKYNGHARQLMIRGIELKHGEPVVPSATLLPTSAPAPGILSPEELESEFESIDKAAGGQMH